LYEGKQLINVIALNTGLSRRSYSKRAWVVLLTACLLENQHRFVWEELAQLTRVDERLQSPENPNFHSFEEAIVRLWTLRDRRIH
jgi:hypothetical protein